MRPWALKAETSLCLPTNRKRSTSSLRPIRMQSRQILITSEWLTAQSFKLTSWTRLVNSSVQMSNVLGGINGHSSGAKAAAPVHLSDKHGGLNGSGQRSLEV